MPVCVGLDDMARRRGYSSLDLDGLSPDEAFTILGNDIRLDIIQALWAAEATYTYDDVSDTVQTVPFSDLRRQVDIADNGRFNYHLSQLTPYFVRKTPDGYRLSNAGKQIARTVIAVSGEADIDFTSELAHPCPLCEAPTTITYEDQWLRIKCTECDGLFGEETPDGAIFFSSYPAAGIRDRPLREALATGFYRCMLDITYLMRDICRECAGSISASLSICPDHHPQPGDGCETCGTRFPVWADQRCDSCGFAKRLPIEAFILGVTPVIGFLDEEGIDVLAPTVTEIIEILHTQVQTTVTDDPLEVSVTIQGTSGAMTVTVNQDLDVIDTIRHTATEQREP